MQRLLKVLYKLNIIQLIINILIKLYLNHGIINYFICNNIILNSLTYD